GSRRERSGLGGGQGTLRRSGGSEEAGEGGGRGRPPANEDPGIRRRIAKIDARIEAMRLCGLRFLTKQLRGEPLGSETSINKLIRAELEIEIGELALAIERSRGTLWQGRVLVPQDRAWQRLALSWLGAAIGGC